MRQHDPVEIAAWMIRQGWTDDDLLSSLDAHLGDNADVHEAIHRVRYRDGSATCPHCGRIPRLVVSRTQSFCGNDDCDVLMWNPSMADGGMSDAGTVDLSALVHLDRPAAARDGDGPTT